MSSASARRKIDGSPMSDCRLRAPSGRTRDDRGTSSPGKSYGEQLAHFHFDQFEQLGVVDHVALVQETMMYGTPT